MSLFENFRTRYHIKSTLLIAIFAFPTGLPLCGSCTESFEGVMTVGIISSILWVLMWKGNEAVSGTLDYFLDWPKGPVKRLVASFLSHSIYTLLVMYLVNYCVYMALGWNKGSISISGFFSHGIPALIITMIIVTFLTARSFLESWREAAINEEKMKREVITTRFEALKNQVNPHFLFNSLNVLSSLVYKDPDLSAKFIKKLSNVYRYVLEVHDHELTDLDSELEFLRSFYFLLKIRYTDGLDIDIDIPENNGYQVAPLALQMLVENAVKHNVISKEEPLSIKIFIENNYLVVNNNLQKKTGKKTAGPQVGLTNIKDRYTYFTDQPVVVTETSEHFEVKLPVLKLDK